MADTFSKLLLATEHTEFDAGAERAALVLARKFSLPLHVIVPLVSNPEFEAVAPELAAREARRVAADIDALRGAATQTGVTFVASVRSGDEPWREIVDEASNIAAGLIVIRRRGKRGWLANLLVGEMVTKVIANAPCSVLTVPRVATLDGIGVVSVIADSATAHRVARVATELAKHCSARLRFVGLPTSALGTNALDEATNAARAIGVEPVDARSLEAATVQHIVDAARGETQSLFVIDRAPGSSHAARALAHELIGLNEGPVLLVHE